jgi:hypothetical protein
MQLNLRDIIPDVQINPESKIVLLTKGEAVPLCSEKGPLLPIVPCSLFLVVRRFMYSLYVFVCA